ncbi:RNA-binding protein 12B-like isoform 1-T2 [Mantella aurantiaca]
MTIIVRLQGLPPVADSFDIRQFFYGLNIPRGGVYITGGKYGEAFIIFASFEDAEYAMTLSGRPLKTSYIYLSYSNEAEMRRALEVYRIAPNDSLGGLSSGMGPRVVRPQGSQKPSFMYIHGMSQKITKVELREFFKGFTVEDVIFLKFVSGVRNGNALIKFKGSNEASDALKLDGVFLGGSPVTLRLSDEDEWNKNGGDSNVHKRDRSPPRRSPRRSPRRTPRRSPRRTPPRRSPPRRRRTRTRSRSPVNRRERRRSPYIREFYVHIINVSYRAEKGDLKKFFFDLDMDDSHITFLLDKEGRRTREAFAMFTTQKDYKRALNLNLESFKGHTINILPISKKGMFDLIDRMKSRTSKEQFNRKSEISQEHRKYVFLRNFASNVTKADVIAFFKGFSLKEDDITLLFDDKNVSLGEALAKFADEKEASNAEKLNHEKFQGTDILLSRISEEQMKALTKGTSAFNSDKESKAEELTTAEDLAKAEDSMVSQACDAPETNPDSSAYAQEAENSETVPPLDSTKDSDADKEKDANKENDGKKEADVNKENDKDKKMDRNKEMDVNKKNGDKETDSDKENDDEKKMDGDKENDDQDMDDDKENDYADQEMDVTPPLNCDPTEEASDSTDPLQQNSADEYLDDSVVETEDDVIGNHEEMPEGMTLVFIRNLPVTTTSAEISDFLHDYKVSSVNLKYIGKGEATVRMSDSEAKSAIETLNKKEVGLKQVLLSLI